MSEGKLLSCSCALLLCLLSGCSADEEHVPQPKQTAWTLAGTVVPDHGPASGSTRIRVAGSRIPALATLQVGGAAASSVQVAPGGTWIEGLTPLGQGVVDVTVQLSGGQRQVLAAAFRYDPGPVVERLEPATGPQAGGTRVEAVGSGFAAGARVLLGSSKATEVEVAGASRLSFLTPPGQGKVELRVVNPDGQVFLLRDAFTYLPRPRIILCEPASGAEEGGTVVTVTGTGFQQALQAFLGEEPVGELVVDPPSTFRFTTPPGQGEAALRVVNPDGQDHLLEAAFRYLPRPVVTGVEPGSGPEAGGLQVEVQGTGFVADLTRIYFGGSLLRNVRIDAEQGLATGSLPPGSGVVAVHAANLEVVGPGLAEAFRYVPPPRPESVAPVSGPAAGGTLLTVRGSGFLDGASVLVGGVVSAEVQVQDAATLSARTPPGEPGLADVTVVNPDGQRGTLPGAFRRVPAPEIAGLEPGSVCVRGGDRVTVAGRHFQPGAEVFFGPTPAEVLEQQGASTLVVLAPPGEEGGEVDVTVVNPDGQLAVLSSGLGYTATPLVGRVVPPHGPLAGGGEVEVQGSCFTEGASVLFGGEPAEVLEVAGGGERLRVVVPPRVEEAVVNVEVVPPAGSPGVAENGYVYHDGVYEQELAARGGAQCGLSEDLDGDGKLDVLLAGAPGGAGLTRHAVVFRGGGALPVGQAFVVGDSQTVIDVASVPLGLAAGPALAVAVDDLEEPQGGGLALLAPLGPLRWEGLAEERYLARSWVFSVGVGDLTGDGLSDIVAGGVDGNLLFVNQGAGSFVQSPEWIGREGQGVTMAVLIADLIGDAAADLFLAVRGGGGNVLLEGTGGGGFIDRHDRLPLTETRTLDAVALDIDRDGDLDLILAEEGARDRLWLNEADAGGGQHFRDVTEERFATSAETTVALGIADLDGDGLPDILAAQGPGAARSHRVHRMTPAGGLEEMSESWLPRVLPGPGMVGLAGDYQGILPAVFLVSADETRVLTDRIGP